MTGNDYLKKANHPIVSWAMILAALGLGANALISANSVENLALANEKDIFYERAIRETSTVSLEEKLEALDEDIKEVKDDVKEEAREIKELLNELLLQRAISPTN